MSKRKASPKEEAPQKQRKGSISEDEFAEALLLAYSGLTSALSLIPDNVAYVLCFTGSLVLRALQPGAEHQETFRAYLKWRYENRGHITDDCDIIFEEDPSIDLQREIRKHNRNKQCLRIDWWESSNYTEKWAKVKSRSLRNAEKVLGIPCQPYKILYKTKKEILSGDIKHRQDALNLPKL